MTALKHISGKQRIKTRWAHQTTHNWHSLQPVGSSQTLQTYWMPFGKRQCHCLCQEEKKLYPRKWERPCILRKKLCPTLNRDAGMNCQDSMILYWQHLAVLGHYQYPEMENQTSVNTQLPPADDRELFLWKFWNLKMWVLIFGIQKCECWRSVLNFAYKFKYCKLKVSVVLKLKIWVNLHFPELNTTTLSLKFESVKWK